METTPLSTSSTSGKSPSDIGMPIGLPRDDMDTTPAHESVDQAALNLHEMVDRFAAQARPAVEHALALASDVQERLREKYGDLSAMEKELVDKARTCVRDHPMVSIGVAVAAGLLISRLTSSRRD